GTNRLEVVGARGRLVLEDNKLSYRRNEMPMDEFCKTSKTGFGRPELWNVDIPVGDGSVQHRHIIENFCNAILNGEKLLAPMEEGVRGLELGNAMLLAGLTGEVIELPMDAERYHKFLMDKAATSRYPKKVVHNSAASSDFNKSF
ncbi:MAG: hypothetical protein PHS41_02295, partial [Victivallaceae bacterium]|nr:hypothetical protein [Victivallaceae bacterium]